LRSFSLRFGSFGFTFAARFHSTLEIRMLNLALFLQEAPDPAQIQHLVLTMMALLPLIIVIALAVIIIPFWFICKKAGFSPWLSLLNIVPLGNLVLIYVLAFAQWKVLPAPQAYWQPPVPPPPQPPQPPLPPQA
jgi:hypothetical protein